MPQGFQKKNKAKIQSGGVVKRKGAPAKKRKKRGAAVTKAINAVNEARFVGLAEAAQKGALRLSLATTKPAAARVKQLRKAKK